MISMFPRTVVDVVEYPNRGDYDINVWCDNDGTEEPFVHLTFYPLVKGEEYDTVDTSTWYTLAFNLTPRGPKQRQALNYIKNLVNSDSAFDLEYTDWWSNECVLADAPELITDYMAKLPREGR
jgi:hypothetical protein